MKSDLRSDMKSDLRSYLASDPASGAPLDFFDVPSTGVPHPIIKSLVYVRKRPILLAHEKKCAVTGLSALAETLPF